MHRLLALCLLSIAAFAADDSLVVSTTAGKVEGVGDSLLGKKIAVFRGIPFAAPPVGDLRWRPPQPAHPWQGVRSAKFAGSACLQRKSPLIPESSEDCLTLNVYTPRTRTPGRLPVMVWIHGGAFRIGSSSIDLFDASWLARRDVVVVSINYRQGFLGFFAHPALASEPMNFGLLDQIAGLQWVRDNAAAFGGDPANITAFGESGGAVSIELLLAAPAARGLFHKAILQSGGGWFNHSNRQAAEQLAAQAAGPRTTAAELRAMTPTEILAASEALATSPDFGPIIGDATVPLSIEQAFQNGAQMPIPIIVGANSNEGSLIKEFKMTPEFVFQQMGAGVNEAKALYSNKSTDVQLAELMMGDLMGLAPARWIASQHSRVAPTWNYYFTYVPWLIKSKVNGAAHGAELPFVFDSFRKTQLRFKLTPKDRRMVNRIGECWANFAKTSTPACDGVKSWPTYNPARPQTLEFGPDVAVRDNLLQRRLDFYEAMHRR